MSQPTDHPPEPGPTFAAQKATAAAHAALADTYGHLPAPYITVHSEDVKLGLQFKSPDRFEAWRVALGVDPAAVQLHDYNGSQWLSVKTTFMDVPLEVTGHGFTLEPVTVSHAAELRAGHPSEAHDVDDADDQFAALAPGFTAGPAPRGRGLTPAMTEALTGAAQRPDGRLDGLPIVAAALAELGYAVQDRGPYAYLTAEGFAAAVELRSQRVSA